MKNNIITQKHPFHLVDPSPWPFFAALSAFMSTTGGVMYMHGYTGGGLLLLSGIFFLSSIKGFWWRDVVREAVFEGQHTKLVQDGLRNGMLLFIISEVMFFFAFFWAFFHSSLAPIPELGSVWPPAGIEAINAWKLPLLNTVLLLSSGATVTVAHHAIIGKGPDSKSITLDYLLYTVILATVFTLIQVIEYNHAPFTISDSVFGSTFFMATGFHGFHVLIGTTFLVVCTVRIYKNHFTAQQHVGLEAAIWYWHFVDVVWLFLFVTIYWWGGN
jgi:cytochrome c oxidase subunit 3